MNESSTDDIQTDIESAKILVENFKQLYQTLNVSNVHNGL
jgi:hypothetical protein